MWPDVEEARGDYWNRSRDATRQTQMERYCLRCSPNADGMLLIMLFTKHRWNATDHVACQTQMDDIDVKTKKL
jgi:hypothetical protein